MVSCSYRLRQYLQTGQVLFRDLCTSERAVNPPAATQ